MWISDLEMALEDFKKIYNPYTICFDEIHVVPAMGDVVIVFTSESDKYIWSRNSRNFIHKKS